MENQFRDALEQSLVREHRQAGIRLSRATTYITCLCGAEFTGPDWWTRHLVEEATRAVQAVAEKISVDVSRAKVVVVHPPERNEPRRFPVLEVSTAGDTKAAPYGRSN